jgi:hypothetical protein
MREKAVLKQQQNSPLFGIINVCKECFYYNEQLKKVNKDKDNFDNK